MNFGPITLACLIGSVSAMASPIQLHINPQGLAQHDLSIRGSSYSGAGISINGLNLKSPWSAHFNSELPIAEQLFTAPEVHSGLVNASGHLIGTTAYTTDWQATRLQKSSFIGTEERYGTALKGHTENSGAFVEWEKARRIDYDENDLNRTMGGAHLKTLVNDWTVDLLGGYQQKKYGTRGYFGSPDHNKQETIDTLVFAGAVKGELDDSFIRSGIAFRQLDINDLNSHYGIAMLEGQTMEIQHIVLQLHSSAEHEYADGNSRTRGSFLFLPKARFEHLIVKVGVNSVFQTSEASKFLPITGINWLVADNTEIYTAYSETVQQPDFQTLQNNPMLQMQASQNSELGLQQFFSASLDWQVATFHRQLKNASDWISGTATDLGSLNIYGAESTICYSHSANLELNLFYQWIHKSNNRTDGLYELDYPEHILNLSACWKPVKEFSFYFNQSAQYQTENDARTSSNIGANASLGLHWLPHFANNVRLSFQVENLWGSSFQAIPGLKPRPTTSTAEITVNW
ncbi:MAG TPA: TonB-dependent receptor [Pontiella sp.]